MNINITEPQISDLETIFELWKKQHDFHYKLDPIYYKPNSQQLDVLARKYFEDLIANNIPNSHILIAKIS